MKSSPHFPTINRFLLAAAVVLALALWMAGPVRAHAVLVRSVPESGAILLEAPPEIVLEFAEALDPAVSRVELLDSSGQVMVPGPGFIDPGAPQILRLQIAALPDGTYSAVWRARSAVDGHTTNSSLAFSVGEASSPASLLPPPGTPDPATLFPSTAESIVRWLSYLSAALALGSLSFGFLVWRPAYRQGQNPSTSVDESIRRLIQSTTLIGLAILQISTLAFAIVLAAEALELPLGRVLSASFSQLFAGRIGLLLGVRLLLTLLLAGLTFRLPAPGGGSSWLWWLALGLGGLLILTFSLQGHAAARGSLPGIVMIWLHLAGTIVWLGGLPLLVLALRRPEVPASMLVPRFSRAALVSVGAIAATGIYNALTYVGNVEALTSTTYGWALIAKTGLFALLFALGAVNLLVLSPRLQPREGQSGTGLARTVPAEIILGVLLLLAVGVLSGVSPAYEALQVHQQQGILETASVDGVDLLVRIAPGATGENEIAVEFTDTRPGAEAAPPTVLLRLTDVAMNMGTQEVEATSVDGDRYSARGSFFSMTGPWELEVVLRRPGFFDVFQTFQVDIQE